MRPKLSILPAGASVIDQQIVQLSLMVMIAIAVGGVIYVSAMPFLGSERRVARRVHTVAHPAEIRKQRVAANEGASRKKAIQETLQEIENKRKALNRRLTVKQMLAQTGLSVSLVTFYVASGIAGLVIGVVLLLTSGQPLLAAVGMFAGGLGLPRWFVNQLRKRRQKKFLEEFPNAIDIVVRGIKAGLPLNDTVRVIAGESAEPVRSEFREVVEAQAFGVPIGEAVERMYERVPLPEVNFLAIVIAIQSQSGGNLAEALSNLSRVLRDRKRLKGKIQAMSQEAKASAAIIAALPIAVMLLVYITTPSYISLLWQDKLGHIMLGASAVWMTTGVLVMRKMINFDF